MLAQFVTQMKNAKNGCRDINCATKITNCQHKQRTANRTIPTGKLQNRQLPYKESTGKNFAGPPLATKQDGFRKEYVSATPQAGVLRHIITA